MSFQIRAHTHTHTDTPYADGPQFTLVWGELQNEQFFSPGETWPQEEVSASRLRLRFLCGEQLTVPCCGFTAGTEVQGGLVDAGRLQGQGEMFILVSGDSVPFRDVPFASAADVI